MEPLLPDATAVFTAWAAAHPALRPLHRGRVDVQLSGTYPALRVVRLGSPPRQEWEDRPEVQVECWARTEPEASLLARTLIAALPDFNGAQPGGRVQGAYCTLGPLWSPGEQLPRYIVQVAWLSYPA